VHGGGGQSFGGEMDFLYTDSETSAVRQSATSIPCRRSTFVHSAIWHRFRDALLRDGRTNDSLDVVDEVLISARIMLYIR
jgi:hypothetical protein